MRSCILSLLLCCYLLTAMGQPVYLLHKPYADKYYYADSLHRNVFIKDNKADEGKITTLKKWAVENGDEELAGEFMYLQCKLWYSRIDRPDAEFEKYLVQLKKEAAAKKLLYLQVNVTQELADYYWNKCKDHSRAFENYMTAYKQYSSFKAEDFPQKREYIYKLGNAYYAYEDYDNTIKFMDEAQYTKPATHNDLTLPIYNTLGLCYRYLKKYDSSDSYFRRIYEKAGPPYKNIAGGNIGINYFYQQRYDEAIPLLEQDIALSLATNNDIRNAANSLYILSIIYCLRHDVNKAESLLLQALQISRGKRFWPDYQLAEHIYKQLYKVYTAQQNLHLANLYADSALNAKDSFQVQYNALSLSRAQERTEFVQHKLDVEQLMNQKKMYELIRNSLLIFIFLLMVIGILFINRQRLRRKKLEAEKKNAEADLQSAGLKLDSFRSSVQEKNQLIEHFTNELERIKAGETEQTNNELRSQLERAVLLTDEQWEDFRALFEQIHKGFFGGLKKRMPDLTQAEIRFLALTKLKLTSKEMASMLGISPNAIRIYRHRLRKKFDLDKDDMIDELVDDI